AVQAYLAALADGETPPQTTSDPPNLAAFVASLSSAWHAGEIRPTFSIEAKPRYLRSLQKLSPQTLIAAPIAALKPVIPSTPAATAEMQEEPKPVYAEPGQARVQALRMVWPIVCRRLEEFPNINATQLFEELCVQFPGRFTRKQYKTLVRRVNLWRQAARARGVV
ncbi:transposase, partial [Mesorhizobium sp. M1E.F.Ca.ET.041.01.1.1]